MHIKQFSFSFKCDSHTELVQYRLMSSLMAISFLCNLGPV